ncbi:MAG: heme o synthase [Verrucomicrobiota bacterium]|jgi:protoheme IX farnesyltransferase
MTNQPTGGATFRDYLELTKPRLSLLSVLTAMVGYFSARPPSNPGKLTLLLIGTSLAAGGVAALNQWMEHDTDAQMKRTANRPIPTGKVPTGTAFVIGWVMCIVSLFILFAKVDKLAAFFTLLTIISYLGWYTPAKKTSRWSTEIGAIAGAFPPLIGWSAAEGGVSALGWILFGVLFFWQVPHFMAVAWTYRKEYSAVHFPMLPVRDESGHWVAWWSLVNCMALVVVSILPVILGLASNAYGVAAVLCGAWFLWRAVAFLRRDARDPMARKLFFASIAYLPLLLCALVADRLLVP